MSVKVMKFGGTSVTGRDACDRVYDIVAGDETPRKVVVVSAPSGVTTLLFAAAADASHYERVAERLCAQAAALALPPSSLDETLASLRADVGRELPADEKAALVASWGERASAALLAAFFRARGLAAEPADARAFIVTDGSFLSARWLEGPTRARVAAAYAAYFARGVVPVVTGYIGADERGRTTTLGRGGSDLTATILGACLGAAVVEIWSDADGVMSADPRVVADARLVPRLSYDEAVELSNFGAKIVFNKALLPAVAAGIPVHVRNTFHAGSPGTLITADDDHYDFSVTSKSGVAVITVANPEMIQAVGYLARLFEIFEDFKLSVDVVAVSEASVSVTVNNLDEEAGRRLEEALARVGKTTRRHGRSIVTTISKHLARRQAVFPAVFAALASRGIDVEMVSYGNSRVNLTLLVDERREREALHLIHNVFRESCPYVGAH